ncbi:MAG TPA: tetratricopeptide repeat protein [Rhizomicrobium sp.]|jgi:tetratricopeptide (TPR) repeat protein|nr:tetratricopeptide repeat protein [Rhizomicrobium sp.]
MRLSHVSALIAGAIGATLLAGSSQAAITVLGTGMASDCYQAAEFGGDPRAGVSTCTQALDEPISLLDRAATFVNRGILEARIEMSKEALDDYNIGIKLRPDLAEAYIDRGATYIAVHRYAEALQDIDKGIGLGARQPEVAYYDRAIAHEGIGDIRGAYEDYKKALELQPNFALAADQLTRFKVVKKPTSGGV